jgi:hypothetical protein
MSPGRTIVARPPKAPSTTSSQAALSPPYVAPSITSVAGSASVARGASSRDPLGVGST